MVFGLFGSKATLKETENQLDKIAEVKKEEVNEAQARYRELLARVIEREKEIDEMGKIYGEYCEELEKLRRITKLQELDDKKEKMAQQITEVKEQIEKLKSETTIISEPKKMIAEVLTKQIVEAVKDDTKRHFCGGVIENGKCLKCKTLIL